MIRVRLYVEVTGETLSAAVAAVELAVKPVGLVTEITAGLHS